jgi:hypothetical protein
VVSQGKRYDLAKNSAVVDVSANIGATNAQLQQGVPPAVTNSQSGEAVLQPPGTALMFTMPAAGRLWAAEVSYSMGSSAGTGSNQGYCRVRVAGGKTLAIVECCVVASPDSDSNTDSLTFPGIALANGAVIDLDVNGGAAITGVVQRGSGLVVVSVP